MTYYFHPGAKRDLRFAAGHYRGEGAGLPKRFLSAVDSAIHRIVASPELMSVYEDEVRYCPTNRFPYIVLFRTVEEKIEILAIKHTSRDEEFWRNRLDEA